MKHIRHSRHGARRSLCTAPGRIAIAAVIAAVAFGPATATIYEYDMDNRLIDVRYGPGKEIRYQLDPAGNLLRRESTQPAQPIVDTNSNMVADSWETNYFGNLTNSMASDNDQDGLANGAEYSYNTDPIRADTDGDGMSDTAEIVAHTDPADAGSYFQIDAVSNPPAAGFTVNFQSATNRFYTLGLSTNLNSGFWTSVASQAAIPGSGGPITLTDTNRTSGRYYRITVSQP